MGLETAGPELGLHTHNGILLSNERRKIGSFVETWMDLEAVIQSKVSYQKKNISYINT